MVTSGDPEEAGAGLFAAENRLPDADRADELSAAVRSAPGPSCASSAGCGCLVGVPD